MQILFRGTYFVEDIGSVGDSNEIEGFLGEFSEMGIGELSGDISRKLKKSGANESEMMCLRAFRLSDGNGGSSLTVVCEDIEIVWVSESGVEQKVQWD